MITSASNRLEAPGLGDVVVTDWEDAGLRAPSSIRAGQLVVVERRLIAARLGTLSRSTLAAVEDALRAVFGLR